MTNLLIKLFIKNNSNKNSSYRESYDMMASIVGIVTNTIMALIKLVIGLMLNSVSIMADAMNQAMDSVTNLMLIITGKMSRKPADIEHPFGHAKLEYVATFIIAMLMLLLGYEFVQTSIHAIVNPEPLGFDTWLLVVLILTALFKIWQSKFYKFIGFTIDSAPLVALSKDSFNDVLISLAIIISVIFTHLTNVVIDGYISLVISVIILHAGLTLAKENISKLLGENVPASLAHEILDKVKSYDEVLDVHDLIIHSYGSTKMASIVVDVLDTYSLKEIHLCIDQIERDVEVAFGIDDFLIRITPIPVSDARFMKITDIVESFIKLTDSRLNANDYKIIDHKMGTDVLFELDVPFEYNDLEVDMLVGSLTAKLKAFNSELMPVIEIARNFVLPKIES